MSNFSEKVILPELLAPAGNFQCALAAFKNGADAVYAGLQNFNARERTENFTVAEMSRLIEYAESINKKVYITLNTLIKESELDELYSCLETIAELAPAAVIVQDLGVVTIIKKFFPELKVHASTQMAIHNSAGVAAAADFGVERVILERQLSMEELKKIIAKAKVEIEVFVHGALCCSLSGTCLFSSWLGGWSGNRGRCKQPCRRRFFSDNGNGFFFSTQDLYSLDLLPQLIELGVKSLKIEGRLKKPDYVANVVAAYRLMLDGIAAKQNIEKLLKEAKVILQKAAGRKWSHGFFSAESAQKLIEHEKLGVSGILSGFVVQTAANGFSLKVSKRLHLGDRIRIQPKSGDDGPALTITRMTVDNKVTKLARKGTDCFIYCDKEVPLNGMVYKIGETSGEIKFNPDKFPLRKQIFDLRVVLNANGIEVIPALNGEEFSAWTVEKSFAEAQKRSVSYEDIVKVFVSADSNEVKAGKISVDITGALFVPASVLKQLRREFWQWLKERKNEFLSSYDAKKQARKTAFNKLRNAMTEGNRTFKHSRVVAVPSFNIKTKVRNDYCSVPIYGKFNSKTEVVLPAFCTESELRGLTDRLDQAVKSGVVKFRVTSLYALNLLKKYKNLQLTISFPLPVCNSLAAKGLLDAYDVKKVQAWIELEKGEIESLRDHLPVPTEVYCYGRPALLVTRAKVAARDEIKDVMNNSFLVKKSGRLAVIYPKEVLSLPSMENTSAFIDLMNAKAFEKESKEFNFNLRLN